LQPAVVLGGLATLALAALWPRLIPSLRRLEWFESGGRARGGGQDA
jgi:hypothetical protein